ncbi:uncharacterized protein At4g04980-like [Thrips palmi]|uniref:Uncharacterized protein At4g04980-like n=1 Tax=Thrips palmi TaxID=161013 RepID=A0A6P8YWH4_THRPL|nr:uncharacterized protein At4g04980-like [Thrips palmi]
MAFPNADILDYEMEEGEIESSGEETVDLNISGEQFRELNGAEVVGEARDSRPHVTSVQEVTRGIEAPETSEEVEEERYSRFRAERTNILPSRLQGDPTIRRRTQPSVITNTGQERGVLREINLNPPAANSPAHASVSVPPPPPPPSPVLESPKSVFVRLGPKVVPVIDAPEIDPVDKKKKKKRTPSVRYRACYVTPQELDAAIKVAQKKRQDKDEATKRKREEELGIELAIARLKSKMEEMKKKKEEEDKKDEEKKKTNREDEDNVK